jgi:serine protease
METTAARVCLAILASGLSVTAVAGGRPDLVQEGLAAGRAHRPGELLVQFQPGVRATDNARALRQLGASVMQMVVPARQADGKGDLVLVHLPAEVAVADAVNRLQGDSTVDFVEPNWIYQHDAVSNDTLFTNGSLWGMYGDASSPANQFGSQAAEAWAVNHTCNSGVYVGVIDEGYMFSHEDLTANAWLNPFDPVDGVDNDGNGYVDDTRGWDFDGGNNTVFDGVGDDHGSHVSGTIAGAGGNGKGVAGVCWSARIINAKFLGSAGGTTANAILAVDYITDLKTRHGLNIVATNNSWGGGGFSQGLMDAIERARTADILFIAAAGNSTVNNDTSPHYPSTYTNDNIIAVASITSTGGLSSFSNFGAVSVDLGAPGSGIYSTVPVRSKGQVVSAYASFSGTSMATPHVTGAAALYASTHPGSSYAAIKSAILSSTIATPSLSGKVATGGRLNVSGF